MDRDNYYVNDPYTPCDSPEEPVLTETDLQALDNAYQWYAQNDGPSFISYVFGHQTEWGNETSIANEQLSNDANGDFYDGIDWSGSDPCPECGPPVRLPNGKNGEENTWVRHPATEPGARDKWTPRYPVPTRRGGQPDASWDPNYGGHWDLNWGDGGPVVHIAEDGTIVDHYGNPVEAPQGTENAFAKAATLGVASMLAWEFLEGLIATNSQYLIIFLAM
jgi:hypothetical protein